MSKKANHIHRYKKVNLGRNGKDYFVYKCMKPICSHYIPLELAEGKLCECNRCGESMVISKAVMTGSNNKPMTFPHCVDCTQRKKGTDEIIGTVEEFLERTKV